MVTHYFEQVVWVEDAVRWDGRRAYFVRYGAQVTGEYLDRSVANHVADWMRADRTRIAEWRRKYKPRNT